MEKRMAKAEEAWWEARLGEANARLELLDARPQPGLQRGKLVLQVFDQDLLLRLVRLQSLDGFLLFLDVRQALLLAQVPFAHPLRKPGALPEVTD